MLVIELHYINPTILQVITQYELTCKQISSLTYQLACGLKFLQSLGIMHRVRKTHCVINDVALQYLEFLADILKNIVLCKETGNPLVCGNNILTIIFLLFSNFQQRIPINLFHDLVQREFVIRMAPLNNFS